LFTGHWKAGLGRGTGEVQEPVIVVKKSVTGGVFPVWKSADSKPWRQFRFRNRRMGEGGRTVRHIMGSFY